MILGFGGFGWELKSIVNSTYSRLYIPGLHFLLMYKCTKYIPLIMTINFCDPLCEKLPYSRGE